MYISAQTTFDRSEVKVWERLDGVRVLKKYPSPLYFFVEDENGDYQSVDGKSLKKLTFDDYSSYYNATAKFKSQGRRMWESDIPLEYKVLSEHYYKADASGTLNITFYDIEIDYDKSRGFPDVYNMPYAPINAVSFYHKWLDKMIVIAVPPTKDFWYEDLSEEVKSIAEIKLFRTEAELLRELLNQIEDSDILCGWNSETFDDPYIYNRIKMILGEEQAKRLSFEGARAPYFEEKLDKNNVKKPVLVTSGRILLDLMLVMMKFEPGERDSFALESVADEMLDDMPKLKYEGSLADLYRNDFNFFLRYNARDSEILKAFESKKAYIQLCILLSHMDTGLLRDVTATIRLTEMAIINECHHELNLRVPNKKMEGGDGGKFAGAFVLPPNVGEHDWIGTIDVNSLYPSTMRSLNISFDSLIGQFTDSYRAYEEIYKKSDVALTCVFEDGNVESLPAIEWGNVLRQLNWAVSGYGTIFSQEKQGIIPKLLTGWFSKRKELQKKAAEALDNSIKAKEYDLKLYQNYSDEYRYYNLLQTVFKLKLNSTYGACGNQFFRFFDVRLAESTTRSGREILFHMTKMISKNLCGVYEYPNPYVLGGDTDSCFFKTLQTNYEDASRKAKQIAQEINDSFNEFSSSHFLLAPQFLNLFAVSQEVIADKAIITAGKKNYMMHMVEKDGKKVDKMKITGLAIKKSTTPKKIRKILTDYFERYLKGESWDNIGLALLELKEKLNLESDIELLGLPKKIKNLERYTSAFETGEKNVTIPGHCMASILWNKSLDEFNDKESLRIVSGMRIRTIYFRKPIGRFKSIAIPVDLDVQPDWFTKNFIEKMDARLQVEKIVDNVCKPIIKAIGKTIPSRKTLQMDELVQYE